MSASISLYISKGMVVKYLSLISGFRGCQRSIAFEPKGILSFDRQHGGVEGQVQKLAELFDLRLDICKNILKFYLIKVIALFPVFLNSKK